MKRIALLAVSLALLVFTIINFFYNAVDSSAISQSVNNLHLFKTFETNKLYFYIHLMVLSPILLLSFDKKVFFYKKYKYLPGGIIITASIFLIWDMAKAHFNVWQFNPDYITGKYIGILPVEEYLFFLTVPFACIFINECLNCYKLNTKKFNDRIILSISVTALIITGIVYYKQLYTSTVCFITASTLIISYLYIEEGYRQKTYYTYLLSLIPFLFINGILTGAFTIEPAVCYNTNEIIGLRIISIPIEDAIYLFPLLHINIIIFEFLKNRKRDIKRTSKITSE